MPSLDEFKVKMDEEYKKLEEAKRKVSAAEIEVSKAEEVVASVSSCIEELESHCPLTHGTIRSGNCPICRAEIHDFQ